MFRSTRFFTYCARQRDIWPDKAFWLGKNCCFKVCLPVLFANVASIIVLQRLVKSRSETKIEHCLFIVRSCLVWQLLLTGLSAVSCPLVYNLVLWSGSVSYQKRSWPPTNFSGCGLIASALTWKGYSCAFLLRNKLSTKDRKFSCTRILSPLSVATCKPIF